MTITDDIIRDLLPLYAAGECSKDSRKLVDEYLASHPGIAEQARSIGELFPSKYASAGLNASDELGALMKTRRRLRLRTVLMAFAIFFSLAPFAFVYANGTFYWLVGESPVSAAVYFIIGVVCWIAYGIAKHRTRDL